MSEPQPVLCPWCAIAINDDDTIQVQASGQVWHASCKDRYDTKRRREAGPPMSTAVLFERTDDPRPLRFPPPTINYHITPRHFRLEIPVEALAGMSQDAHTRMLAMLNAWITEHKPVVVKGPTP